MLRSLYWVGSALGAQRLPPGALRALQLQRLRRMIAHCQQNVPFYGALWAEAGVGAADLRTLEDLARFPIPDRRALEEEPERLVARPHLGLYRAGAGHIRRSGGSSGGPQLEVHADAASWARLDGFYFRALRAVGYDPRVSMAYFWGAPLPRRGLARAGLMMKVGVPAHLDEESQLLILEQNPGIWWYYHPTSLFPLAKRFGERLRATSPRGVISHAELLPRSMRAAIEAALSVPVYDQYGTSEFNRMAWECPARRGYHIDADSVILEVLGDDDRPVAPGETGRAVVTGLINQMMPLIRYELGDLVVASDRRCECGRTLPMIEGIEGRAADVVTLPGGGRRTPRELLEPYGGLDGLEQYRIAFEGPGEARFEYASSRPEVAPLERAIRAAFEASCPGVLLSLRRVDALEKAPTGKRRMVSLADGVAGGASASRFVE